VAAAEVIDVIGGKQDPATCAKIWFKDVVFAKIWFIDVVFAAICSTNCSANFTLSTGTWRVQGNSNSIASSSTFGGMRGGDNGGGANWLGGGDVVGKLLYVKTFGKDSNSIVRLIGA